VVDDDRDTRELYKLVFEVEGYSVTEADSVAAAVDASRRVRPDVILADWRLGDGDGLELCQMLRRHGPTHRIPVIAATGLYLDQDLRARAGQLGCETVLTKPIDVSALVRAVAGTLQVAQARTLRAAAIRLRRYSTRVRRNAARQSAASALTASDLVIASRRRVGSAVALMIADDAGHFVAANDRAAELTGYEPSVLATMSVADLTPPPNGPTGQRLWTQFIDAGTQEGVYLVKCRDGLTVPMQYVSVANIAPGLHLSALTRAAV
jgi:PAS domain S-box-containing protein